MLCCAALLSPKYKSFRFSTPDEKKNFIQISKEFMKKNTKLQEAAAEEIRTLMTTKSNASFYAESQAAGHSTNRLENELNTYLKDEIKMEFSEYWLKKKLEYPLLFKLARLVFSCPATSMSSELDFLSCRDQFCSKKIKQFTPQTLEKLMEIYGGLI